MLEIMECVSQKEEVVLKKAKHIRMLLESKALHQKAEAI